MRVAYYRRNFWGPASGGDQQIVTYARHLRRAGHEPSVLIKYPYEQGDDYFRRLNQVGVPVTCLLGHPVCDVLRSASRFARRCLRRGEDPKGDEARILDWSCRWHLRVGRPHLLHIVDLWENLEPIRIAHAAGIPILYQDIRAPRDTPEQQAAASGASEWLGISWYDPLYDDWYRRLAELLPLCAGVATLSPRLASLFRERVGYTGPMGVVPLIVEGPDEPPPPRQPTQCVTFGFAGRLERLKGPQVLLIAWESFSKECPSAVLRLAGTGGDEPEMFALARNLGLEESCRFIGIYEGQEGKAAFMKSIDAYVLPSFTEGTPNGIIEAMAYGLPVVATQIGGIPDVVTPQTGILVPPGDVHALVDALRTLAADRELRVAMGQAARQRYEQLFAPKASFPLLLDTYRQLTQRSNRHLAISNGQAKHPWAMPQ
jgi:glycosyltransferase involved in cell wall biosynthesis